MNLRKARNKTKVAMVITGLPLVLKITVLLLFLYFTYLNFQFFIARACDISAVKNEIDLLDLNPLK